MSSSAPLPDLSRLCIHTITTKPWAIETSAAQFAAAGVKGITVWRDTLAGHDVKQTGRMIRDQGLSIVSLCRGGFFPAATAADRAKALDDNRKAIAEAYALGAPLIVLVCGAVPGQPLAESRKQITDGIAALLPECKAANVKLAIEPLHPMYAADRACINTLAQALDLVEALGEGAGVAIDTYHVWWDPELETQIARAGRLNKIFAYHICDWLLPTRDLLLDRGMMGDGVIDFPRIRRWIEAAGYRGFTEVEIFSKLDWWTRPGDEVLKTCIARYTATLI